MYSNVTQPTIPMAQPDSRAITSVAAFFCSCCSLLSLLVLWVLLNPLYVYLGGLGQFFFIEIIYTVIVLTPLWTHNCSGGGVGIGLARVLEERYHIVLLHNLFVAAWIKPFSFDVCLSIATQLRHTVGHGQITTEELRHAAAYGLIELCSSVTIWIQWVVNKRGY